ncbi:MAG: YkgJ family cysteine cluster protein [Holophagales bacterium]|nr:YkgJ family cysteine cluster protein [Holophagales bacterium]
MTELLPILDAETAERATTLETERPSWPCRRGCDACCRSLAEPLRLTRAEWRRCEAGLDGLELEVRRKVERRLREAVERSSAPYTCPFLERRKGACRVYAHRPIACRAYGYYRSRDGGRYCERVKTMLEQEGEEGLVWGNHDALESRLERAHGPSLPLATWIEERGSAPGSSAR